jgi:hypothetical protein
MSRLTDREIIENNSIEFLKDYKRNTKKYIRYYATKTISYPTDEQLQDLEGYEYRVWSAGDTYQALASLYYGDPTLWWIIATINQKPTEFHLKVGDVLLIPTGLSDALSLVGVI